MGDSFLVATVACGVDGEGITLPYKRELDLTVIDISCMSGVSLLGPI